MSKRTAKRSYEQVEYGELSSLAYYLEKNGINEYHIPIISEITKIQEEIEGEYDWER